MSLNFLTSCYFQYSAMMQPEVKDLGPEYSEKANLVMAGRGISMG